MTAPPTQDSVDLDARLARMERLVRWLDDEMKIPGTEHRVGWDAVIGLAPGVGDLATAALSVYVVNEARALGASKVVIGQMLWNVALDSLVGIVPVLGDLFDTTFKANRRNMNLLKAHLGRATEKETVVETTARRQEGGSSRDG